MKKIDYEKSKNYGWKFDEEAIGFSVKETPLAFLCSGSREGNLGVLYIGLYKLFGYVA